MELPYKHIEDLASTVDIPQDGVLSRNIFKDDTLNAIVFAFDTGQELSEHTASMPAIIQIIKGEARLTLGDDEFDAQAGTWAHMQANLKHSIYAKSPVIMLLLMLKNRK
ncbi:MAG: cupin domain-containing protein [Chloroflexota bacterium]